MQKKNSQALYAGKSSKKPSNDRYACCYNQVNDHAQKNWRFLTPFPLYASLILAEK